VSAEAVGFYLLAALMVGAAAAMILARHVVHAVLYMVANFVGTAVLYLMLQAPFIAAVQVIVYAGAIMVLFLFVVMLLGAKDLTLREPLAGQRLWGVALAASLGAVLTFAVIEGVPAAPPGGIESEALSAAPATGGGGFGSPQMIGAALFRDYVLPLEVMSILLLIAMLGAVVIARYRRGDVAGAGADGAGPDAGGGGSGTAGGGG